MFIHGKLQRLCSYSYNLLSHIKHLHKNQSDAVFFKEITLMLSVSIWLFITCTLLKKPEWIQVILLVFTANSWREKIQIRIAFFFFTLHSSVLNICTFKQAHISSSYETIFPDADAGIVRWESHQVQAHLFIEPFITSVSQRTSQRESANLSRSLIIIIHMTKWSAVIHDETSERQSSKQSTWLRIASHV